MELDSEIEVISRRSSANSCIFSSNRHEIDQFLQAVDQIQCSIASGTAHDQIRAKSAIQIAMAMLADEMRNLLKINGRSTHNPDSTTYSSTMTDTASNTYVDDYEYDSVLSVAVIDDLRSIVNRMSGAGYLSDCKKAYVSDRKRCVDASYQKLDVQSNDARTMEWNMLEVIIKVWMKSAKICFRKIFAYEKQLCVKLFGDDDCFLEICNDYAFQLIEVASNLCCIRTASERLFAILELYKTFSDLLPQMNIHNHLDQRQIRCFLNLLLPFHVVWIIMCLVSRLEDEAKVYKNASDVNFYLMNNLFYIVKKMNEKPEVKEMIGDECFEKVSSKFDHAKAEYMRLSLEKILRFLGNNRPLQKRIKGFNAEFNNRP
ncbi:hypothetical protein QVD17_11170 [Tagetes erecta]|uniref:Exocyst subunit Exo70 family protein n=1 Tax=Tagetes erecta TaxID=13708 RepID=A0AAD8P087_TARER|nr:hypothetical protein QVD17_11170 [Tagetes erecta]